MGGAARAGVFGGRRGRVWAVLKSLEGLRGSGFLGWGWRLLFVLASTLIPRSRVAWQPLFISSPLTLKIKINFPHDVSQRAILTHKFKQSSFIAPRFMNTDVHRASFIIRKVFWRD